MVCAGRLLCLGVSCVERASSSRKGNRALVATIHGTVGARGEADRGVFEGSGSHGYRRPPAAVDASFRAFVGALAAVMSRQFLLLGETQMEMKFSLLSYYKVSEAVCVCVLTLSV